jgi:hypothetical protein
VTSSFADSERTWQPARPTGSGPGLYGAIRTLSANQWRTAPPTGWRCPPGRAAGHYRWPTGMATSHRTSLPGTQSPVLELISGPSLLCIVTYVQITCIWNRICLSCIIETQLYSLLIFSFIERFQASLPSGSVPALLARTNFGLREVGCPLVGLPQPVGEQEQPTTTAGM